MSRIHDALKKAESERAAGVLPEGTALETHTALRSDRDREAPPSAPLQAELGKTGTENEEPIGIASLEESLDARCAQTNWSLDPQTMLFSNGRNRGLGTEEFRNLRSQLYLFRKEKPLQKLLVTSALPKEGKTFVSANLAQALTQQQKGRVLLVDADLRFSSMHLPLGTSLEPGLTDYLSGSYDEFGVVQRGPFENLYFIAGGKPTSTPSELIGNGRLKLLFQKLAPAFEWVILDSPPTLPVSDARLLAEHCDGVLMVILAASTPFEMAKKACHEFGTKRVLGIVLNGAEPGVTYRSKYSYYGNVSNGKEG